MSMPVRKLGGKPKKNLRDQVSLKAKAKPGIKPVKKTPPAKKK